MMRRCSKAEQARRLNAAFTALQAQGSPGAVLQRLMHRYGISRRQAYRYVRQARQVAAPWPVPEAQAVFSVKLPRRLIAQVRHQARAQGCALQGWVDQALRQALLPPEGYG